MPVRMQEIRICFGFRKQTDIGTPNSAANMWQLRKLNPQFANPRLNTENDALEYGKGHEFAVQSFATAWETAGTLEKYLTAEFAAWAMAFGLGKVVKSGTSPNFTYTCTPLIPANGDPDEPPYFSLVEQIRPGANAVLDRLMVGCAVNSWTLQVSKGPGRDNAKLSVEFLGSGKYVEPSSITMPSPTVEKLIMSASLALSVHGTDYVASKRIVSLEAGWNNNLMRDYYPGSGFQSSGDPTSGAIAGRLLLGNRQATLRFVALFEAGAQELTRLRNQSTGTAVISLSHNTNNSLELTFHKVAFASVEVGETDGFVTVAAECTPMWDDTNGVLSAVAKCNVDNIGQ